MTIIIKEELYLDLHINLFIVTILDQDIDPAINRKGIPLDDTIIRTDLHPDQAITDQDLEHLHKLNNKIE